jgi:hypothetical protein
MSEKDLEKFDFPKRRNQMAEPKSGTNETKFPATVLRIC